MRKKGIFLFFAILTFLFFCSNNLSAQKSNDDWPRTVLITNDDGINDVKIIELARAFAKVAETYVVAPLQDCSGSTHYITAFRKHALKVESRTLGKGIHAYGVDGFPGDCVLLALTSLMRNDPPDLVISGINGGPNLGYDWIASGTIGAARIATFWGVPAIAVSGLKDDMQNAIDAASCWVVRLAQSQLVRQLKPKQYLTVSIPRIPPDKIKGVRVAERADILLDFMFSKVQKEAVDSTYEVWALQRPKRRDFVPENSDATLYNAGYIVVVPMLADEHDYELLSILKDNLNKLPSWFMPTNDH